MSWRNSPTLGIGRAAGATFGALQDWGDDGNDRLLSTVGALVQSDVVDSGGLALASSVDSLEPVWAATAEQRDIPSFFQIRSANGASRVHRGLRR